MSRLGNLRRPAPGHVVVNVDGQPYRVRSGASIAAALLVADEPEAWRPEVFCGMGICYGCIATVDGSPGVRTCITPVADGMRIERDCRG